MNTPSHLSQVENALEKAEQCLGVFNDLSAKASEATTTLSDYFAGIIYRTSYSGSQRITIATRLGEIAIEQGMYSGQQNFHRLTSEIQDTYQSLDAEKVPLYISRIERLREKLLKFIIQQGKLYDETRELRERLPILRKKATPELIAKHEPRDASNEAKGYNRDLSSTLETAQSVLCLLPIFKQHFALYFLEVEGFLLDEITAHIAINNDNEQIDWEGKNNNFNNMPLSDVKRFFMLLTKKNSQGNPFLKESDVNNFILKAFIGEQQSDEKLILNVSKGEIGKIGSLFYMYYNHCATCLPYKRKDEYITLLTDNFVNYTIEDIKYHFRSGKKWINPLLER